MKKLIILISGLSLIFSTSCEDEVDETKPMFKIGSMPTQFAHPESVAYDNGGQFFYVSDIGTNLTPHIKDGDGKIVKLNNKGEVVSANIATTTLHAPKGFVIIGNEMYINDIDAIRVINLTTGSLIKSIDFTDIGIDLTAAGGTGLNDMCVGLNNQTLYVSITNNGSIYQVNLTTNTKTKIGTSAGANGLFLDKTSSTLYVNGFTNQPSLAKISLPSLAYSTINAPAAKGGYDGLILKNNNLYLTDWGLNFNGSNEVGTLHKMNIDGTLASELSLSSLNKTKLNGPADLGSFGDYLFIPAMGEGKVYIYSIK